MSKKVGIITQHRVVNYGSVLQTYALQEKIKDMGYECEVIDYYPERFTPLGMLKRIKNKGEKFQKSFLIRNAARAIIIPSYIIRFRMFFKFLNDYIDMTPKTYKSEKELESENFDYDVYCTGSDQVWNYGWNERIEYPYYLAFAPESARKISYAASFGPKKLTFTEEEKIKIQKYINDYSNLSVREQGSYDTIYELNGKKAEINMDPTILLEKKEWEKLIPKENVVSGEYILYYSLGQDKENIELVEEISKKMKLPVITTRYSGRNELFTNFKRIYDVGPVEFLNLLSNAKLVLTTSFHGTIFSVILNTPFFSINADKDYRRLTLLKTMGLETRNINKNNMEEKLKNAFEINFENSNSKIKNEKEKSIEYLRKALEIGE